MKSTIVQPMSNLRRYLMKALGLIVVTIACWQGLSVGVDPAIAANMEQGSDRGSANLVRQVANLEREPGKMEQVVKDDKNPARSLLNTSETGVKIDADKAERPMGDSPELVKERTDRNAKQAGEFSEKTTKKVKNFFGF